MTARPPRQPRPAMLTVAQAAERLGLSKMQVYEYLRKGLLAHIQYPSRPTTEQRRGPIRIEAAELDRFIDAHRQAATT